MAENEKSISLSDLQVILAEQQRQSDERLMKIIAELKKPTVMEQKQLDKEAAEILAKNEERKANAEGMLAKRKADHDMKRACSHVHPNGNTHCVYIQERRGPGYILCQRNQCIIRPEPAPAKYDGDDIYDTQQFNRLFQSLPSQELFQ